MAGLRICECQFCNRNNLTPQGLRSHQVWCDENPYPGIHPDRQQELREQGILD
jgi:hypothetical protein